MEKKNFLSYKVKWLLYEATKFYLITVTILSFYGTSSGSSVDEPTQLSIMLNYPRLLLTSSPEPMYIFLNHLFNLVLNLLLFSLPTIYIILLMVKIIEFYSVHIKQGGFILKEHTISSWLVNKLRVSYKIEQIVQRDEIILLVFAMVSSVLGFFYAWRWYLLGFVGIVLYLFLSIALIIGANRKSPVNSKDEE